MPLNLSFTEQGLLQERNDAVAAADTADNIIEAVMRLVGCGDRERLVEHVRNLVQRNQPQPAQSRSENLFSLTETRKGNGE